MTANALLNLQNLPQFDQISADQIEPTITQLLTQAKNTLQTIKASTHPTWLNTVEPLTDLTEQIGRVWGVIGHLHSVVNTPELRDAYNKMLPEVTQFFTELGQDLMLFDKFKQIKNSEEFQNLTQEQKQKLKNDLRDFTLSGADLPKQEQERFAQIQNQLAALAAQFSQNLLDATDSFSLYFEDKKQLIGVPEDALEMFAAAAQADNKTGFKVGLQFPHYLAIMQYAEDRDLRKQIYHAYVTRASDLGDVNLDNTPIIEARLKLTEEEAHLLGFENYAQLSLETKMAESPEAVISFLKDLAQKAKPFAQKDYQELEQFAQENLQLNNLEAWDLAFVSEKLQQVKYAFSEQEVKEYFPANKVIEGLFALIDKLYQVKFHHKNVSTWHNSVQYFELTHQNNLIGGVYLDLYAREGKRGGAWMNDYRGRRQLSDGSVQTPVAYLVCNFTPPSVDKQAYLSHDEITTLFHEMGHGLHHLLTQVNELGVSGINAVEWDAVELPSQFMENFAWEYPVLSKMSEHKTTKALLPEELYNKMLAAKNFQSGMQTVRQIEFALFDILLYQNKHGKAHWQELLDDVRKEVAVVFPPEFNRFVQSFGHIFAGGYAAGYYSYKWAEVLSCDAYAAFEETPNDPAVGQRFWQEILAVGGSRPAMDSFIAFRGRKPELDALLRLTGMNT
ncbi:M3 family metallopeptidase [Neisseria sp. Ec49-e6-T10]|uniref:M3 family metallopeptidase n=1 Tax=Neisseria sp. Ec49-e6-T10 TaxID=3140744 RepID=UPI003EBDCD1D